MENPQAFMGTLLMAGGVAAVIYAIFFIRLPARRTFDWPSVTGTVTHAGVRKKSGSTGYDSPNTFYEADVRYRYSVNGRDYQGSALTFGGNLALSLPGRAQTIVSRYGEGDPVDVYFNPAKPHQACLEQGEEVSTLVIGIALVFLLVGWFM